MPLLTGLHGNRQPKDETMLAARGHTVSKVNSGQPYPMKALPPGHKYINILYRILEIVSEWL